jgi:hypothetical protein
LRLYISAGQELFEIALSLLSFIPLFVFATFD